jgi:hypothetical protein
MHRRGQSLRERVRVVSGSKPVVRSRRRAYPIVPILIVTAGLIVGGFMNSPWPPLATIRHLLAAPNCAAARTVGLAQARIGEPGYYPRHDADGDGIACEPWPPLRR